MTRPSTTQRPDGGLDVLAVEPWLGGSHARFLDGWRERSGHRVEIAGLPDRQWRWRMRDGARRLALQLAERRPPDVLLVSDYLDLPGFFGFLPGAWADVPAVLYFHENQLTYPRAPGRPEPDPERDRHFAYTHVLSCLRAKRVVFNSDFHRREFSSAARTFLRRLPNDAPRAAFAQRMEAAAVVGPGVDLDRFALGPGGSGPLAIAFPHRWEHDKDPLAFLSAARDLAAAGVAFELHLFGERYRELPPGVGELLEALRPRIASDGFRASAADHARDLGCADVVVSTARHEFYGIAVLEALATGCRPLLPDRLAYPELLESVLGEGRGRGPGGVLFGEGLDDGLTEGLGRLAEAPDRLRDRDLRAAWRGVAARHGHAETAAALDAIAAGLRA